MTWKSNDGVAECLESGIILHSHIPKTAGTSILKGFQDAVAPDQFMHWNPSNPYNLERSVRELQSVLQENRKLKIVTGHFMYGVHDALKGRPYKYITMLRDPVARVFSHYKHAIQNNLHTMDEGKSRAFIDLEIQEVVKLPNISFFYNNLQSRFISGLTDATFNGRSDADVHEACKSNILNDYCYVGSQSSISTAIVDLVELLNLPELQERTENSRGRIDPRTLLTANQVDDIIAQNHIDACLIETYCPGNELSVQDDSSSKADLSEVMLQTYKVALKLLLRRASLLQKQNQSYR